jgi:hypothetical protein
VAVNYITTWFSHKEKFICCWTSQYMHVGTVSTSREEGKHFVVKKYLKIINADLLLVLKNLSLLLETQFTELNAEMESEKKNVSHHHVSKLMTLLIKNVSKFSLDKMCNQYKLVPSINSQIYALAHLERSLVFLANMRCKPGLNQGSHFTLMTFIHSGIWKKLLCFKKKVYFRRV